MKLQAFKFGILFSSTLFLFSCQKNLSVKEQLTESMSESKSDALQDLKFNTFSGHEVSIGDGKARSFVTISHTGVPAEIGIEMTNEALRGLPTTGGTEYIIPLHHKAMEVTPFDHIGINWNSHGHEPQHVYDVPHFDFHFYKITLAEQRNITPGPLMEMLPPPGSMPPTYVPTPGGVPQMGKHWIDFTSPELDPVHPQPFTKTFIYGSYNSKVIFDEPMITLAVLQSGQFSSTIIPQPQSFMPANTYYPTMYNISKDNKSKKHFITLNNFVFRH